MSVSVPFDSLFADNLGPLPASPPVPPPAPEAPWKVLLVDGEPDVDAVLRGTLRDVTVQGRGLQLLEAHSQAQARHCLQAHPDIAVVLLNVVMESEHGGLELVQHIRQTLGNSRVQILLVTGLPGEAPLRQVVTTYAIDGYRLKSELTADKVFVSVHTALRAYQAQMQLQAQGEALQQLAQALQEREARLRALIETAPDAIVLTDAHGLITGWNPGAEALFGYDQKEMLGHTLTRLAGAPESVRALTALSEDDLPRRLHATQEVEVRRSNGERMPVEMVLGTWMSPRGRCYSAILRDISQRKAMEAQIRQLAFYDPLTNLPNRRLLLERLELAIAMCKRTGGRGALMMLDLDNFKTLNDTHGHDMGDRLLIEAARRMQRSIRNVDAVGRLGGDEFLFVLGQLSGTGEVCAAHALQIAEKIRLAVGEPYHLQAQHAASVPVEHRCTATIGVTLIHGDSRWEVLRETADRAMYAAKAAGRNTVRFA